MYQEYKDYLVLSKTDDYNKETVQRINIPLDGGNYRFIYIDIVNETIAQDKEKVSELISEFMRVVCPSVSSYSVRHSILQKQKN